MERFEKICDAYYELLQRDNAKDILINEIIGRTNLDNAEMSTSASGAVAGDVVFFGTTSNLNSAHSAVLTGSSTGEPIATRIMISKWGSNGVFSHRASQMPDSYDISTVTIWHRQ